MIYKATMNYKGKHAELTFIGRSRDFTATQSQQWSAYGELKRQLNCRDMFAIASFYELTSGKWDIAFSGNCF